MNNINIESGMISTRKGIMPKKFEAHQNVEAHQAPDMFFHDIKIGGECSNIRAMLPSAEPTDVLCKLLKVQSALDMDMECFDGNVLEYLYFMALFREVVESKIEDPRCRLTRLIKYTVGNTRDLIEYCIQLPSIEGFTQAKYLLEKIYGNPHRTLASYRKEVKHWPKIRFGDSRGFRKFHSFLLKCRSVAANQRWNTLNSPDILYMMASKLHGGLTERWKREVSKIRRHHRREPDLEDFIMYIEEETMLMSDPLFFWEALLELNIVKERPARRNKVKGFLTVSDEKTAADDKNDKKPPHCPLCNSSHDLDECRNFNEMEVEGRSKLLFN